jgi:hypothetical protein
MNGREDMLEVLRGEYWEVRKRKKEVLMNQNISSRSPARLYPACLSFHPSHQMVDL